MTGHGYTYTTLTGGSGEPMSVHTSFYLDRTATISLLSSTSRKRPFLSIDHGTVAVTIGPRPDAPFTEDDVALVREFAEKAAGLRALVEQFYADQTKPSDETSGSAESAA